MRDQITSIVFTWREQQTHLLLAFCIYLHVVNPPHALWLLSTSRAPLSLTLLPKVFSSSLGSWVTKAEHPRKYWWSACPRGNQHQRGSRGWQRNGNALLPQSLVTQFGRCCLHSPHRMSHGMLLMNCASAHCRPSLPYSPADFTSSLVLVGPSSRWMPFAEVRVRVWCWGQKRDLDEKCEMTGNLSARVNPNVFH